MVLLWKAVKLNMIQPVNISIIRADNIKIAGIALTRNSRSPGGPADAFLVRLPPCVGPFWSKIVLFVRIPPVLTRGKFWREMQLRRNPTISVWKSSPFIHERFMNIEELYISLCKRCLPQPPEHQSLQRARTKIPEIFFNECVQKPGDSLSNLPTGYPCASRTAAVRHPSRTYTRVPAGWQYCHQWVGK